MSIETNVGDITVSFAGVQWTIPNFLDLPQEFDADIRSPHFHFDDENWFMKMYPNGHAAFSSLGWVGIGICTFISEYKKRTLQIMIGGQVPGNFVLVQADFYENGFFGCIRSFPTSFLKSWKELILPEGILHIFLSIKREGDSFLGRSLFIHVQSENVDKWFKEKSENCCIEASTQTENENPEEELKNDKINAEDSTQAVNGNVKEELEQNKDIDELSQAVKGEEKRDEELQQLSWEILTIQSEN